MASPRYCLYLFVALHFTLGSAGPLGPLPNVTSLDLGANEGSCALGDVVYMSGDEFPGASACERCACAGGRVRCERQRCEPRPGCKAVHRPDHCCPTYQCECEQEGRVYGNGEKLVDPLDPCRVCYCQGGEVVCRRIACFVRDDCQPRLVPGRCCPEYDNCPLRGVTSVHSMTTVSSTPSPKVNASAVLGPSVPIKPGFTIKEITPVSEIPVITDVKIKEIIPSPNMDVAEYSSSKSPLIPREVTSEKSSIIDPNVSVDSTANAEKSELNTPIEENTNLGDGSTPSKISFSTQDSINSEIYPSNIPSLIMMGSPSEPIALSPLTTKATMIEEEDPSLFDHNPAFPPIPDDLSVLGNHDDEILPEQHFENEHIPGINDLVMTNEKKITEAPVIKESPTTLLYVTNGGSATTENLPDLEISSDNSMTKIDSTVSSTTQENAMINLRSVLPTQILNIPSFISDDTTDDMDTTTEIQLTSDQHSSFDKGIETLGEESVDGQNTGNETNSDSMLPQTTENLLIYKSSEASSTEMFSENQPSSILIETSDQNPHDVSEKNLDSTLASSTPDPLKMESVSDIITLSRMETVRDTSLENMETTEYILSSFGSQESATDGVDLIKISSDSEKSSALIEPPRGRKYNVLTDLINLVDDVASISDQTEAPEHTGLSSTTISDSEELIPVNAGYKSKNNNWNLNSITEMPLKSKSQTPSKQKNVEMEDDDEVDNITDSPPPNDKVEPTTKRPIIDNVSDGNQHNKNGTFAKKDIEIITKSYVPTINRRPTKVIMEDSNDNLANSDDTGDGVKPSLASNEEKSMTPVKSSLNAQDATSTPDSDEITVQPFNTSSTAQ